MPRAKTAVTRERRARVLATLAEYGADRDGAVLSLKSLANASGLTFDQVRGIVRWLRSAGFVVSEPRKAPNGGTAENAYRVTAEGKRALASYRAAPSERVAPDPALAVSASGFAAALPDAADAVGPFPYPYEMKGTTCPDRA